MKNEFEGTPKQEPIQTEQERILEALNKLQHGEVNNVLLSESEGTPKQEVVKTKEERILEAIEQLKWAEISDGLVVEREFEEFKKIAIDTYLTGDKAPLQNSLERRKARLEEDLASGHSGKNQNRIINHGYKMIEAIQNFIQIVDGE